LFEEGRGTNYLWDSDNYFTDEQLETAKTQLAIQDVYGREKTSTYVHTVTLLVGISLLSTTIPPTWIISSKSRGRISKTMYRNTLRASRKVAGILMSSQMQNRWASPAMISYSSNLFQGILNIRT
jgi:hypothetical protein